MADEELARVERLLTNLAVLDRLPDKGDKLRVRAAALRAASSAAGAASPERSMVAGARAASPPPSAPPPASGDVASLADGGSTRPLAGRGTPTSLSAFMAGAGASPSPSPSPSPARAVEPSSSAAAWEVAERHKDDRVDLRAHFERQYRGVLTQREIDKMVADAPALPSWAESAALLRDEARRGRLRELDRLRAESAGAPGGGVAKRAPPPPPHPHGRFAVSPAGLVTHAPPDA